MANLDRAALRRLENRILVGLVEFYSEGGYTSSDYRDPESGGVYEHKLAHKLGFKLGPGDSSPPEFTEACRMLEAQAFVRRLRRSQEFQELGIWPTVQGLERAEYLSAGWLGKLRSQLCTRWPDIAAAVLTAALTTIATLAVSSFMGFVRAEGFLRVSRDGTSARRFTR